MEKVFCNPGTQNQIQTLTKKRGSQSSVEERDPGKGASRSLKGRGSRNSSCKKAYLEAADSLQCGIKMKDDKKPNVSGNNFVSQCGRTISKIYQADCQFPHSAILYGDRWFCSNSSNCIIVDSGRKSIFWSFRWFLIHSARPGKEKGNCQLNWVVRQGLWAGEVGLQEPVLNDWLRGTRRS